MNAERMLRSAVTRGVASRGMRRLQQLPSEFDVRFRNGRRVVEFFHQPDDPHSHLAIQVLERLRDAYAIDVEVHLVPPSVAGDNPTPERYQAWARRDVADVAAEYGLTFADPGTQPAAQLVALAGSILSPALDRASLPALAVAVGTALWNGDGAALEDLAAEHGIHPETTVRASLAAGVERRRQLGHYAAGMFHFGGTWYWGVDRLFHLEARLAALGAARGVQSPLAPRPGLVSPGDRQRAGGIRVECFASVRSPYTAILLRRLCDWIDATGVELVLRPVLPMVMRGVALSREKGMYIVQDTAREAEQAGTRFGWLTDPLGAPAERALALWPWAREQGQGERYLVSCLEAAWADGIDLGSDRGLARAVERCNLSWSAARPWLDHDAWREEIEANRQALYDLGLWGVPSFRVTGPDASAGEWSTWGQDRLWRVTREAARRADL